MADRNQENNVTEINNYEDSKRLSLLDRIKESILKKNDQSGEESEKSEAVEPVSIEASHGRGVFNVSEDSLLFSLWSEWKRTVDVLESGEPVKEKPVSMETFELVLEAADAKEIPMTDEEIELEKQRATLQLMVKAKNHEAMIKPNEEGIAPDTDSYMVVHVAQRRMAAWAFVFPPSGNGAPLKHEQVHMALHEYSVKFGVDYDVINYIVNEQPYFKLIPIAYGKPMVPGKDGTIVEKYKRKMEKMFAIGERGEVDYRVQNYIQTVHAGDVLCEAIPPTHGRDGCDVLGTLIPAKEGVPVKLLAGQNAALNEEKTQIVASMDGHLQYENGRFNVKALFFVPGDVDFNVGNIDYLGDVHIAGDVRDDFVIHATGTVTVDGLVEGAVIEAGKDVFIAKGILGDEKAVIKAGGNVQTEYIENCIIYAGDTVRAGSIISSFVYSDNQIIVRAGRGTIIGGKMVAANLIDAKVIGCRTERPMNLTVGELPYIQQQKEEIMQSLKEIGKEKEEVERSIRFLSRNLEETDPEKLQNAANFRLRKSILAMKENHLYKQLSDFEDKKTDIENCRIIADTIYPITRIFIKDAAYTVTMQSTGCKVHKGIDGIELV